MHSLLFSSYVYILKGLGHTKAWACSGSPAEWALCTWKIAMMKHGGYQLKNTHACKILILYQGLLVSNILQQPWLVTACNMFNLSISQGAFWTSISILFPNPQQWILSRWSFERPVHHVHKIRTTLVRWNGFAAILDVPEARLSLVNISVQEDWVQVIHFDAK